MRKWWDPLTNLESFEMYKIEWDIPERKVYRIKWDGGSTWNNQWRCEVLRSENLLIFRRTYI